MADNVLEFPKSLKRILRGLMPKAVLQARKEYITQKVDREFSGLNPKDAFTKIYSERLWGKSSNDPDSFSSGSGSRQMHIVSTYLDAVKAFLTSLGTRPDVVDLGCGDFSVGAQIRQSCGNYIGCDIVDRLIARNAKLYRDMNVDFRVVDIASDELPDGDVVFLRQVLQHLSNDLILKVIPRIQSKYKYLILTEHLPAADDFPSNIDKPTGPDVRLRYGSGVILTRPPFNVQAQEDLVLCQAVESGTLIQTRLYRFV